VGLAPGFFFLAVLASSFVDLEDTVFLCAPVFALDLAVDFSARTNFVRAFPEAALSDPPALWAASLVAASPFFPLAECFLETGAFDAAEETRISFPLFFIILLP
jgi:hypothetical protein